MGSTSAWPLQTQCSQLAAVCLLSDLSTIVWTQFRPSQTTVQILTDKLNFLQSTFLGIRHMQQSIACWVAQAAHQIADAASCNAYNEKYASPYTVEAVRQGMDLPWWQKLAGARLKDGKLQLAQLTVSGLDHLPASALFQPFLAPSSACSLVF